MLIKNPPPIAASFKMPDLDAERKLLYEVLQERRITVRERVAKMERNLADIRAIQIANKVPFEFADDAVLETVRLSDLMIATIRGPVSPRPQETCPYPQAIIDPEWIEILEEHYKTESGKFLVGTAAQERMRKDGVPVPKKPVRRRSSIPPSIQEHPQNEDGGDEEPEAASSPVRCEDDQEAAQQVKIEENLHRLSQHDQALAAKLVPVIKSIDEKKYKKPMLQSVASKLRKSLHKSKTSKKAKKLKKSSKESITVSGALSDGEEDDEVVVHGGASNQSESPVVEEDAKKKRRLKRSLQPNRSRMNGFFISMADAFAFGGSGKAKKPENFEYTMSEILQGYKLTQEDGKTICVPVQGGGKGGKQKGKKKSKKNSSTKKKDCSMSSSNASQSSSLTSGSVILSGETERDQDYVAGAAADFDHFRFYFNSKIFGGTFRERKRSTTASPALNSRKPRPHSMGSAGLSVSFSSEVITAQQIQQLASQGVVEHGESFKSSKSSRSFSLRKLASGKFGSRKREGLNVSLDGAEDMSLSSLDQSSDSFKRTGDMSGLVSLAESEYTILEEDEEEDDDQDFEQHGDENAQESGNVDSARASDKKALVNKRPGSYQDLVSF